MIYFTGDVSLTDGYFDVGFGIGSNIAKGQNPLDGISKQKGDVWIGNFEGVASDHSCNKGYHAKVFRIHPSYLSSIRFFDVWGLANNHAMQHGDEAYLQTVATLEQQGCKVFGTEKCKSITFEYKKRTICVTGLSLRIDEFSESPSYWHNPEYIDIEHEIGKLPKDAFKVLFVHWGNEYVNYPSSAQKKLAHWLVDIGFDLVIGMHPHVLQGYENYKDARIYYSLGNFVFNMPSEPCRYGAVVELDFDNENLPTFSEAYVFIDRRGKPKRVDASSVPNVYRFEHLNKCLRKESNSEPYYDEVRNGYLKYRKANRKMIMKNFIMHPKEMSEVICDFIKRKI